MSGHIHKAPPTPPLKGGAFIIIIALLMLGVPPLQGGGGGGLQGVACDTARITRLLIEARESVASDNPQDYVAHFARGFLGAPYVAATLESPDGVERLVVDLDEFDCTTLVETVCALSRTAASGRTSWRDYVRALTDMRYRKGVIDGYPSRLHYIADWVLDNSARGNLTDAAPSFPTTDYVVKTLDFMTRNADKYPALADSANLAAMKRVEEGYRSHRFPYIRKNLMLTDKKTAAALREGDIVALTCDTPGLDVSHLGIIVLQNGVPYLLHASSAAGAVVIDKLSFADYLKKGRRLTGFRVLRLPK